MPQVPGGIRRTAGVQRRRGRAYGCATSTASRGSTSKQAPLWALRDETGIQAMRVRDRSRQRHGHQRGAVPSSATLFDGDHGRLFVAATELRRGDEVHFLSEDEHPSLLALIWRYGAPVVVLALTLRRARALARRGPLRAARAADRTARAARWPSRSAAPAVSRCATAAASRCTQPCVRALDEAAQRRITSYATPVAGRTRSPRWRG